VLKRVVEEAVLIVHLEVVCGQLIRGCPPPWGLGQGLTTSCRKRTACCEMLYRSFDLAGFCEHGNELSGSKEGGEYLG